MKIIITEVNAQTGEETIIERDESAADAKERLSAEKIRADRQAITDAAATAKASLLARLGITADEAKLLIG